MSVSNLHEILYLLVAAIVIVAVFKRLHLSPVLGYLVAGGAIGPHGLNYISETSSTAHLAEFGVVFLLFMIGLELTFERLKSMRKHVFGFGSAQMLVTTAIMCTVLYYTGIKLETAIIIAGALALSSTAVVLQVLADRGEQSTQVGRLALATLILQDLTVVPLLIMVPLLADENANLAQVAFDATTKAVLALFLIFIIGRRLLRPLYHAITQVGSHELFIATTLLIMLGAAVATQEAGLSLALGAFLAGLLVAETEYSPQVAADIAPFKDLLMGLFFMSVGMSLDFHLLLDRLPMVLLLSMTLILGKASIIALLCRIFRFRMGSALQAGLVLAQGGEFAFVLFGLAFTSGLFDLDLYQMLLVVVTVTMALTPLLAALGAELARRFDPRNPVHFEEKDLTRETLDLTNHTIVLGFNKPGETICKLMQAGGIRFVAVDTDPKNVHRGRKESYPVYFGKTNQLDILESVGIQRASAVAVMLDERSRSNASVKAIRQAYPELPIIARARDRQHASELRDLGASIALAELFESSMMLGIVLLKKSGIPPLEAARIADDFRAREDPKSQVRYFFKPPTPPEQSSEK